jgi:hypothetical protein
MVQDKTAISAKSRCDEMPNSKTLGLRNLAQFARRLVTGDFSHPRHNHWLATLSEA